MQLFALPKYIVHTTYAPSGQFSTEPGHGSVHCDTLQQATAEAARLGQMSDVIDVWVETLEPRA